MAFKIKNLPPNEWTTAIWHAEELPSPSSCCFKSTGWEQLLLNKVILSSVVDMLSMTRPAHMHRGTDIKNVYFSCIANQKTLVFQSQALFPNITEKQIAADGDTMRRENRRNWEISSVWLLAGLLSKRFQSQKPFNVFKQFITLLTLFIYHRAVVKRTGVFFAIFICGKEALFSGICTHTDSKAPWGCDKEWTPQTVWTNLAPRYYAHL